MKIFLLIAIIGDPSNCTPFLKKQRFIQLNLKKDVQWGNALRHSAWNFAARDTFSLYLNLSKDLVPIVFSWLFSKGSVQYNLPHASESFVPNVKSTFHGRESLPYLGPKIWDLTFKKAIKKWKLQNYPCRVFKNTFKISVLFDTFSETLDKGLLPNFIPFVRLIGSNWLVHEIISRNQVISGETKTNSFDQIRLMVEAKFGDNCKGFIFF